MNVMSNLFKKKNAGEQCARDRDINGRTICVCVCVYI